MRRPVDAPYRVTSDHGDYTTYAKFGRHSGYDYAVPLNRPVYAPKAGKITFAGWSNTGGNMIVLYDGVFWHRLLHHEKLLVSTGDRVTEGQEIGKAGTTGLSSGYHVHWDISEREVAQSFADFIDNDLWLKGQYNNLYSSTTLLAYQRKVGAAGVNERTAPKTTASIFKEWPANEVLDFKGYVIGETVRDNNVWFVGKYNGRYFWSGAFTSSATTSLPNITPQPAPAPSPTPTPEPDYAFTKDLPSVTEVIPAGIKSFEYGNFPASPAGIVLHDFGTDGKDTYESTVSWFKKYDNISAHFVVSKNRRTQMVALKDRAYHAGPNGNVYIGIELDPAQDPETVASGQLLIRDLEAYYKKPLQLFKHTEFMQTLCGDDFELATYDPRTPIPVPADDRLDKIDAFLRDNFRRYE